MAILNILHFPDPRLRHKAKPVAHVDDALRKLIDDMFETMYASHGLGLAANQVGVSLRILVMGIPEGDDEDEDDDEEREERPVREYVLINPQPIKKGGERQVHEGCLSIPGYRGELKRAEWVKVKGLDRDGREVRLKATDLLAQCLEHEIDHLDGILYVDRMKEQGTLDTLSAIAKNEPPAAVAA